MVAPGISEALVATALGLLAAIPAVIFYNKLSSDADRIASGYEAFADEFATILSRQLDALSHGRRVIQTGRGRTAPPSRRARQAR